MHLETWQWIVAILAAFGVGVSKTGLPGAGILAIAVFAVVVEPQASVGLVLPLLICGDVCAVFSYRQHADIKQLTRLFPWAAAGIILGWVFLKLLPNYMPVAPAKHFIERSIGVILVAMVILHLWRKYRPRDENAPHGPLWTPSVGLSAGFTTMVANAAGPLMALYMLSMKLPKLIFMGTSAWYFLILNVFKVPFSMNLGIINFSSVSVDAILAPCTVIGALAGRALLPKINQQAFEAIALAFSAIAGTKLLFPELFVWLGGLIH